MKKSQAKHKSAAVEKENLCCSKQSTRTMITRSNYQKLDHRKRSLSVDFEDRRNKMVSSTKKTPFHVHVEQSLNKISSVQEQITFRRGETRNSGDSKSNTHSVAKIEEIRSRHFPHLAASSTTNKKCVLRSNFSRSNEAKTVVPKPTVVGNKSTTRPIVSASCNTKLSLNKKLPTSNSKDSKEKLQKVPQLKKQPISTVLNLPSKNTLNRRIGSKSESTKSNSQRHNTRSKSCSTNPILASTTIDPVRSKFRSELNINLCHSQSRQQTRLSKFDRATLDKSIISTKVVDKKDLMAPGLITRSASPSDVLTAVNINKSTKYCSSVSLIPRNIPFATSVNNEKTKGNICHQRKYLSNIDFSPDLAYHTEYLIDLLNMEAEKEENAPKLSTNFLGKYINCEQREILVIYLLRLSSHCHYPSFILYQAVKLLDVVMDRIPVETADMQLTALAVLWIILKREGSVQKTPSGNMMIALAKDLYDGQVALLAKCERVILAALDFNIIFSDPFSIFVYYVINCNCNADFPDGTITTIYYCGGYVIDLSLLDVNFCHKSSHLLAVTVAELVLCILLDLECYLSCPRWIFWRTIIMTGVNTSKRFDNNDINVLRATLISHVIKSSKKYSIAETVYKKYDRSRYGKVSELFVGKIKKLPITESILL